MTARDDDVALEGGDKIILRHTSGINNYVDAVEQRGEFIRYTTEVIIIDKNGKNHGELAHFDFSIVKPKS